ncbi:hypothetical protein PFNF54_05188 [Plasmodium falciparum NF54]|uniref:Uncharacterized protein n=1 Tax=Plasmodium falciparum (isolate NF54) TaxID=5843 RepID=W7JY18_PLAFO|nr:hypothetical protein PFNF54_05188 [Plasmodium falciparum NF54]
MFLFNILKEEIKRRIISEQKRMEDNLWNKIQLLKIKQKIYFFKYNIYIYIIRFIFIIIILQTIIKRNEKGFKINSYNTYDVILHGLK